MRLRSLTLAITTLLISILAPLKADLVQWKVADGGNGHWYDAIATPGVTWTNAAAAAEARGGHLATILSEAENDFVFGLIDSPEFWIRGPSEVLAGPWLGGFQPRNSIEPGGGWQWLNDDGGFGVEDAEAFTNWHPPINGGTQQPDNYLDFPEDALQFFSVNHRAFPRRSPFWNDGIRSNTQSGGYIVEFETLPTIPDSFTLDGTVRDFRASHPNMDIDLDFDVFSVERGIVKPNLERDRTPEFNGRNAPFVRVTDADDFFQWYHDTPGTNLAKTHAIEFQRRDGVYSFRGHPFTPIDGSLFGNEGNDHNDHFTFELHATFSYRGDEFIEIVADDDLWLFIDGDLVLDMGGIHDLLRGGGSLDVLGLTVGKTYALDLFYAERKWGGSLIVDTNMDLHTLLAGDANADGVVDFDDFIRLSRHYGEEGDWRDGDFDRSGTVTFADFILLSANFGPSAAAPVPEPNASVFFLAGLAWLGLARRRVTRRCAPPGGRNRSVRFRIGIPGPSPRHDSSGTESTT